MMEGCLKYKEATFLHIDGLASHKDHSSKNEKWLTFLFIVTIIVTTKEETHEN
jgi:hypothetical protein